MAPRSAPIEAMEARLVNAIPRGKEWQYEPKWDGFRCLLSKDREMVAMHSKAGQDLARYFPEVVAAARKLREPSFIIGREHKTLSHRWRPMGVAVMRTGLAPLLGPVHDKSV